MAMKSVFLLFGVLVLNSLVSSDLRAQVVDEGPMVPLPVNPRPGYCFVRDSAQSCADKMGVAFDSPSYCDGCTAVGQACTGTYVVPSGTEAVFNKNRAISIGQVGENEQAQYTKHGAHSVNEVVCGDKASCSVVCATTQQGPQTVLYCPVVVVSVKYVFYNLYQECPQHVGGGNDEEEELEGP